MKPGIGRLVARDSISALSLRSAGALFGFAFSVLIARFLGASGTGVYFLCISVANVASVMGRLGMDQVLVRYTSAMHTSSPALIRNVHQRSIRTGLVASMLVTCAAAAGAFALGAITRADLVRPLLVALLAVVPLTLLNLEAEAIRGLGKVSLSMAIQGAGVPFLSLVVFLATEHMAPRSPTTAVAAFTLATYAISIAAVLLRRKAVAHLPRRIAPPKDIRAFHRAARALLGVALMNLAMAWGPTLLLGMLSDNRSVGEYAIAARIATLLNFVLLAANGALAPRFASLNASGDMQDLERLAQRSSLLVSIAVVPLVIVIILAPQPILGLFGSSFSNAVVPLVVLAVGEFANVLTGSVGNILMMTGHESDLRRSMTLAALLNVILNVVLIPSFGSTGAAIATATGLATLNLGSLAFVWRRLHIWPLPSLATLGGARFK